MNWIIICGVVFMLGLILVAYLDNVQEWVEEWMPDSFIEKFRNLFGERPGLASKTEDFRNPFANPPGVRKPKIKRDTNW